MKLRQSSQVSGVALPPTLLLTDQARLADPIAAAARQPRGAGIVVRNYGDPYREDLLKRLRTICRECGLVFLVAGHPHLALRFAADGCHLPEHLHHLIPRAKIMKPNLMVTAAAHSFPALHSAQAKGADAALISPVFHTKSHTKTAPIGPLKLAQWANQINLPLYALGGITSITAQRLQGIRLAGLAGIGGF